MSLCYMEGWATAHPKFLLGWATMHVAHPITGSTGADPRGACPAHAPLLPEGKK